MIDIELGTVQETLLLPLIARAEESTWKEPILYDAKAVELVSQLNFDKKKALRHVTDIGVLGLAVRAVKMDAIIKNFMLKNPKGKILNIGAGLDTAFFRCDDGKVLWYDLDLPDSMELRNKLLPNNNPRVTEIPKSMLDYTWIDDLGDISGGLLIFVPGVFPYFSPKVLKPFFLTIADRLPGAQMVFDSLNDIGRFFVDIKIKKAGMNEAHLKWGLWNQWQLFLWTKKIEVLKFEPFFEGVERKKSYGLALNSFMFANDLSKTTNLVHIKFKKQ